MNASIKNGIFVGIALALAQASLSVALLKWTWNKKSFYAVWGGSTLARFAIFGVTAWVVHRWTQLNLAATLLSMVVATMIFLIIEVGIFLFPKK